MKVLVTGGVGYIGSHTVIELLDAGHEVVVVDSLVNSHLEVLERLEEITGRHIPFCQIDLLDGEALQKVFEEHTFDACIHFAGLKAVGESVGKPLEYYHNNLTGTLTLLSAMQEAGCKNIIFSSSATVYGDPESVPVTEECPKKECTNPYGWTKHMQEQIFADLAQSDPEWGIILLRYFNPLGAHKSGRIGELPSGIPNNLMPYITQVAVGKLPKLRVYGADYGTPDGTCIRDYVHVLDLASGHTAALAKLTEAPGLHIYNLGTGKGYSVLEVVRNFEEATGVSVPYEIEGRRQGDVAVSYADAAKAFRELGWKAKYGMKEMCEDSWRWQSMNPDGYR